MPSVYPGEPCARWWRSLATPHYEVVFPRALAADAQRVGRWLEAVHEPNGADLPRKGRRYSVLLMNQTTEANGYVAWMPRHARFFSTPPQDPFGGLTDWYLDLAIHEGRHMAQFDKLNRGATRVGGWLFGEAGASVLSFNAAPLWFWEGDAVLAETLLTRGGRGRQPSFNLALRAPALDGRRFSYYKHYFGSYKDQTAGQYSLGYPLVAYARYYRDALFWSRVLDRSSKWSFWAYSFQAALEKEYGQSPAGLYQKTMAFLERRWQRQLAGLPLTPFQRLNQERRRRTYMAYLFPVENEDGSVLTAKIGFDEPSAIVRLHADGREERVVRFNPAESLGTRASVGGQRIAWNEIVPDARWGYRQYSVIIVYDIETHRRRRLTRRSKLFNPALSPDGRRVAAVEFGPERRATIVILDADHGREIARLPNPGNDTLVAPAWSEDGGRLVFTRQGMHGRALVVADLKAKTERDVLPLDWEDITAPVLYGGHVFFSSPRSGIDNIYALDLATGRRYQVTSSRLGAFMPSVSRDGRRLFYCEYSQ
ncbi:MAG: hypothetical protein MUF51_11795, partial [Vicinamibacteria bacterium]|nr:hypothetical protein [Vicinamibacteria bacterium]